MEHRDQCRKPQDDHLTFDGVYFAIRHLQQEAGPVLCLIAEDAHGNYLGAWPQSEKSLEELD